MTIINSLIVTMRPRRCAGAISARYSGQVAAAAPTPKPSRIRPAVMMPTLGASAQISGADQEQAGADQQAALPAQRVGQLAAEQRTERGPREQQRADHHCLGERSVSARSSFMYSSAPEMTPVS